MRYLFAAICLLINVILPGFAQELIYPVTNYTTKDYGRDFHPSNMSVLQDKRGIIYAANGFKLLEFDGNNWNSYPINKEAWILSLAIDEAGIIYAGSQNEFGYFRPDAAGKLEYYSLSDSLDIDDLDFTNVWKVHALNGIVVFQSEEKIFIYKNGELRIIKPQTSFHTSFTVNDKLFVRERGKGLLEMKNEDLVHIKGSEIFDTTGIFMMVPFERKILIGTRDKGFWIFDQERSLDNFSSFEVDDLPLIKRSKITGGILTDDRSLAIGTLSAGLILIDRTGKTKAVIDRNYGLTDNEVKQVISDNSGNLWLALNNGISSVEISSPLSFYDQKSGLPGNISSVLRYKGSLYAGTNEGLMIQQSGESQGHHFVPVPGLSVPVRCLAESEGYLLAGTDGGLFGFSGEKIIRISDKETYSLYYLPAKRLLFSGGSRGLDLFRYEGSFRKTEWQEKITEDIIGITADKNDTETVWLGTRYEGVVRIRILSDSYQVTRYGTDDGIPSGPVMPFGYGSGTIFGTSNGIYQFTSEDKVRQELPDSLKNNPEFARGYFSALPIAGDSIGKSVSFLTEKNNKIWICSENSAGYLDRKNNLKYINEPFSGIDVGKINVIYPEDTNVCWLGTSDGLIRYEDNGKSYSSEFLCLIRKVKLIDKDSTLFSGTSFEEGRGVVPNQASGLKPVILYNSNSVRIEFNAPFYEYSDKILYACKLNYDSRWTQWNNENFRDYTNLKEGDYTFYVKSRNVYGTESALSSYSFTVLPPWYRTRAAYGAYVVSGFLLLWLVAWFYSYRLKLENIRLEGIVADRTSEVVRQKDEIVNKNTILEFQQKEIEDSIRYASRIQSAVIPTEKDCLDIFPECFIFFKPLNIVSGDFYWISRPGNKIIFAAADCTGHGVPGAFMSMLGVAFLNEIVNRDLFTEPDVILNHLRERVVQALQSKGVPGEASDGMDIALVSIDLEENRLDYSGAYNPLIMIRNNEIHEIRGDRMPIGIYEKMEPFTKHEIHIENGDIFYLASDGYEDQFGGPHGKKFKAAKFRQMLLEIHQLPMNTQKELLEKHFEEWKGELRQVDDIVVAGIAF